MRNMDFTFYRILKNNQLIGPIPSTLSQIPNLKILYVPFNPYMSTTFSYIDDQNVKFRLQGPGTE